MSEALHCHRFIGDGDARAASGLERRDKFAVAEQLRRQRAPARFTRFGHEAATGLVSAFQRISQWCSEQRAAVGDTSLDQRRNVFSADTRPRRVMHQDEIFSTHLVRECTQASEHRIGAFLTAVCDAHRLPCDLRQLRPMRIAWRKRHHETRNSRVSSEALERVQQKRLACERQVLLGNRTAEARAAARRRDHAPESGARRVSACHRPWTSRSDPRQPDRTLRPA